MRPSAPRQVRRSGMRPSYSRRGTPPPRRPQLKLPCLQLPGARWLAAAILLLVIGIGFNQLTTLKQVRVEGNHTLTTAHIDQLVSQSLSRQWFGHNLILLDTGALTAYLEQQEPGIKQATTERHLPHTLIISIVERQPALNWKTGGTIYLLDTNATVVGPTNAAYAHLPTVTDSSNLPVKVGERVAPTTFISFCTAIAQLIPATGYSIQDMTVPETTSEVYVQTTQGVLLKFDTTRPAGEEIADLQAVKAQLAAAHKAPTQYIDLRIAHKAYYK